MLIIFIFLGILLKSFDLLKEKRFFCSCFILGSSKRENLNVVCGVIILVFVLIRVFLFF